MAFSRMAKHNKDIDDFVSKVDEVCVCGVCDWCHLQTMGWLLVSHLFTPCGSYGRQQTSSVD